MTIRVREQPKVKSRNADPTENNASGGYRAKRPNDDVCFTWRWFHSIINRRSDIAENGRFRAADKFGSKGCGIRVYLSK